MSSPLLLQVFGSTSSGNATLVSDGTSSLLVDCGLGLRYTKKCLEKQGLDFGRLAGVLITHGHSDHLNGYVLKKLLENRVPLFCHSDLSRELWHSNAQFAEAMKQGLVTRFKEDRFRVGDFDVDPFAVPHDARGGTHGYRINAHATDKSTRVVVSTDIGHSDGLLGYFTDADAIVIESNHNREMLKNSGRPVWLQQRIRRSHLSNSECSKFLSEAIASSQRPPRAVVLAHVSQECNTNELARERAEEYLDGTGVKIFPTFKSIVSDILEF